MSLKRDFHILLQNLICCFHDLCTIKPLSTQGCFFHIESSPRHFVLYILIFFHTATYYCAPIYPFRKCFVTRDFSELLTVNAEQTGR